MHKPRKIARVYSEELNHLHLFNTARLMYTVLEHWNVCVIKSLAAWFYMTAHLISFYLNKSFHQYFSYCFMPNGNLCIIIQYVLFIDNV